MTEADRLEQLRIACKALRDIIKLGYFGEHGAITIAKFAIEEIERVPATSPPARSTQQGPDAPLGSDAVPPYLRDL